MFYLRLTSWDVAVTLLLVIRGGLWLGEYLDVTVSRATSISETFPRTVLPDHRAEEREPALAAATRLLCRLHRQLLRIPELSFLPEAKGDGNDLSSERQLRQFAAHSSCDTTVM